MYKLVRFFFSTQSQLGDPSLIRTREILLKSRGNETADPYYTKMIDIAVALGAKREQAEMELMDSFKFEIELAKVNKLIQ